MKQSNTLESNHSSTGRLPYLLVAGIAISSILIQLLPNAGEILQWHRESDSPIGLLGWITGHLTHWSWDHLFWDLAAFLTLSFVAMRLLPERFLLCLSLASIAIPLEIVVNQTQIETYRGLSGIDSAIFAFIIAALWHNNPAKKSSIPWNRVLALVSGIAFLAKTGFEIASGGTVFVEIGTGDQAFVPLASAHLSGAVAGLVAGWKKDTTGVKIWKNT